MSPRSAETEVLAQDLDSVGNKVRALEARLTEVEKIIEGLEAAALTTARALEEVSTHWTRCIGRCAARSSSGTRNFVTLRTNLVYAGPAHRPSAEAVEAPNVPLRRPDRA
jgi:hypothetical protein